MGTPVNMAGNDLTVNSISIGATKTGVAGTTVLANSTETVSDIQNQTSAASFATSHRLWVNSSSNTYKVVGVSATYTTASASGTVQVEVATSGTALGSGTNQLSSALALSGTAANTVGNGTVIASPSSIIPGSCINMVYAGTVTSLAGCVVTITLQRLT